MGAQSFEAKAKLEELPGSLLPVSTLQTLRLGSPLTTPESREALVRGLQALTPPNSPELLQLISASKDPELRDLAIDTFQRIATGECAQTLVDRVDQGMDRALSLHLLSGLSHPAALEALSRAVMDPSTSVSDAVLLASSRALARAGHTGGIQAILSRLDTAPPDAKRNGLLTELMRVSDARAEPLLLSAASEAGGLKTDYGRAAALYALRHTTSPNTIAMLERYAHDNQPELAQAAKEALAWSQTHPPATKSAP
jgi:HEAT repeat protein